MKILLTGSSGYIGSSIIPHLKARGHVVVGFDRRPPTSQAIDEHFQGDLLDRALLEQALAGVETVMHLAAAKGDWGISTGEYVRDNVEATRRVIDAGRGQDVKRWIFYSTVAALGPSDAPLGEKAPFSPAIPYGASKAEAERLFLRFAKKDDQAEILIIRPSVVFGPGNPANTNIYRLIDAIHRGRFVMIGNGSKIKTTSYIDNLVAAHIFLMGRMAPGVQTYIYVDQPPLSTGQLVSRISQLLGRRRASWHLPLSIVKPVAYVADALAALTGLDLPITAARIQKFCTGTNFDPSAIHRLGFQQPVSSDDALRATIAWYRDLAPYRVGPLLQETESRG